MKERLYSSEIMFYQQKKLSSWKKLKIIFFYPKRFHRFLLFMYGK